MAADSAGMGPLVDARAGTTKYIRLAAVSTVNAGAAAAKYDFLIDMAGKISAINAFDDNGGVKVLTYTFSAVYDSTWGNYVKIQNTNKTTAL